MDKIKAKDLDFTVKAFMHAVTFDQHDDIRWFVEAGMNIDEAYELDGYYAIHDAANGRRTDTAKLLLELGADPNKRSKDLYTPLHYAVKNNARRLIQTLIKKGAEIDPVTSTGRTPLHLAAEQGQVETLQVLLNAGANVEARDRDGRTPLLAALARGRYEMVAPLLKAGSDINATSPQGRAKDFTPLVQAVRLHNHDLISRLIEAGADVNAITHTGFSPLMVTLLENDALALVQLLAHGARVNDKGGRKQNPLQICLQRSERRLCDLLIKAGAKLPGKAKDPQRALLDAVYSQRHHEALGYLQNGINPNFGDRMHQRPLNAAVLSADAEMVKLLIQHGADVNWIDPFTGENLAFVFAKKKLLSARVLEVLLKAGLKINVTDQSGHTPLYEAAANARRDILEIMLKAGAGVNSVNKDGWSSLMNAAQAGRIESVQALLKAGADPGLRLPTRGIDNQPGHSAYDIAVSTRNQHCAMLLQKAMTNSRR